MNYVDRLKSELDELQNRYEKLEKFIAKNYKSIDYAKMIMLIKQKEIMLEYCLILIVRLKMEGVDIE